MWYINERDVAHLEWQITELMQASTSKHPHPHLNYRFLIAVIFVVYI